MQDPVVIMNFTHIYEDETFYISEQKSSGEASPAPSIASGSPAPAVVTAEPAPPIASGSLAPVHAESPAQSIVSGIPAPARAASLKPYILDFTTLSGTNGFCDDAAADEIRRRIANFPARGLHFLDNGNYHYVTRFWCEKITEDFALVVYDHHVDLRKPVFLGLMSCGSWICDVLLRNRHCRAVLIIGPERAQADIIERELQSLAPGRSCARKLTIRARPYPRASPALRRTTSWTAVQRANCHTSSTSSDSRSTSPSIRTSSPEKCCAPTGTRAS